MNSSQAPEELLQVVGQVGAPRVGGVHGDEDGHVRVDPDLLAHQLDTQLILLPALRLLGPDSVGNREG